MYCKTVIQPANTGLKVRTICQRWKMHPSFKTESWTICNA